jgi:hypothetical protein
MKLRKNKEIEDDNPNISCFDIRCRIEGCSCKTYKSLKSIYCYIIRAYNHANPDKIITYGIHNKKLLSITIHYIIINLKHFTDYKMFITYITKIINNAMSEMGNQVSENMKSKNGGHGNNTASTVLHENALLL